MPHQDQGRCSPENSHLQTLNRTVAWWLNDCDFSAVTFRDDCSWSPSSLTAAALWWALGDETNLTDRFSSARKMTARLFPRQEPAGSYQAFVKLLRKWTGPLLMTLTICFRQRMQQGDAGEFLTAGFTVFAVDGSRIDGNCGATPPATCQPNCIGRWPVCGRRVCSASIICNRLAANHRG